MNDTQEKGAIGEVIQGNVTPQVVVNPPAPAPAPAPGEGTTVVVNPPAPAPAPAPAPVAPAHTLP
jgi:hypothetical protein